MLLENIDEHIRSFFGTTLVEEHCEAAGSICDQIFEVTIGCHTAMTSSSMITTKLSNPHYLPEICIKVTIINFTVTPEGLEDQLLVDVVKYEQPEFEQQKDILVVQLSDFKRQLKDLEDKIFKLVSEASDDILNDEELINVARIRVKARLPLRLTRE